MNLETIWYLNIGDEGATVEVGESIKVSLKNGEVLIGSYQCSDHSSLTIERNDYLDVEIDFEDVEDIEKIA
ncbi:hypothetical protein [Petroclostridium sp. X23]|uniref:hypothetical protein n=1 Tax=Petroclostridium sp. X23 TaxID=3045146 RepID=UPI0024ACADD2|nr:hypothetical protein [Petroclostridium sp. X23]WHH59134.1 hypothetical protein QKW49_25670 [Petroclostridium sp. X23]